MWPNLRDSSYTYTAQFVEIHIESYDNCFLCRDFEPGTSKLRKQ